MSRATGFSAGIGTPPVLAVGKNACGSGVGSVQACCCWAACTAAAPTSAEGTGPLDRVMELVVSCDGIATGTSCGPELAAQADKTREVRKIADTAARRIRTRTQNNSRRQNPCRRKLPT